MKHEWAGHRWRLGVGRRFAIWLGVVSACGLAGTGAASAAISCPVDLSVWASCYDGPAHGDDGASGIVLSPDGQTVYVTGRVTGTTTGLDYGTEAIDAATGERLWVRFYRGPSGDDQPTSLKLSPDGTRLFITGMSQGGGSGNDFVTEALNPSTGAVLWIARYNGPGNGDDQPAGLAVSADGTKVFVAGTSAGKTTGSDYATVAYSASTGTRVWVARYSGPGADTVSGLTATADGHAVITTGTTTGSSTGQDYFTRAYNPATGAVLWSARYNSGAANDDQAAAIEASPDSSLVFVTGTIPAEGLHACITIADNASTGARVWLTRFRGAGNSTANELKVNPAGTQVFLLAHDRSGVELIGYDALTGAHTGSRLGGSPDASFPVDLEVSPDGKYVFITGTVGIGPGGGPSYTTDQLTADATFVKEYSWVRMHNGDDEAFGMAVSPDSSAMYVTGQSLGKMTDYATVKNLIVTP